MTDPRQIDHDPNEPLRDTSKSPWLAAWVLVALGWAASLYATPLDWHSVGLGALTAGVFVAFVIDITGNKTPPSWRGKPPRS